MAPVKDLTMPQEESVVSKRILMSHPETIQLGLLRTQTKIFLIVIAFSCRKTFKQYTHTLARTQMQARTHSHSLTTLSLSLSLALSV